MKGMQALKNPWLRHMTIVTNAHLVQCTSFEKIKIWLQLYSFAFAVKKNKHRYFQNASLFELLNYLIYFSFIITFLFMTVSSITR